MWLNGSNLTHFCLMQGEENHSSLPFVIISPAGQVDSIKSYLVENDYFGFDIQKVQCIVLLQVYVGALWFAKKVSVNMTIDFHIILISQFH
jgi:hypothetical protein